MAEPVAALKKGLRNDLPKHKSALVRFILHACTPEMRRSGSPLSIRVVGVGTSCDPRGVAKTMNFPTANICTDIIDTTGEDGRLAKR